MYPKFPPVADNVSGVVEFGQTWTSAPGASAIAYGGRNVAVASTIDLDPATAGQQTSITGTGGTFALQPDGTVLFTPAAGYHGPASASYTINDQHGRVSNVATLSVFVKRKPGVPVELFSFETGTQGFSGTVSQSSVWASDGTYSLLDQTVGNWISASYTGPDLSVGYSVITLDALNASVNWGYVKMSIQAGPSSTWCESSGTSLQPNGSGADGPPIVRGSVIRVAVEQVIGQVRIARQQRSMEVGADPRAGQPFAGSPTGAPMAIHPEPCTRPDELSGMWSPESS